MCKKNYVGLTWDSINNSGSATCLKAEVIGNCEFHIQTSASVTKCYSCKSNYAVAYNELSCVSYSTDKNCRQVNSDNSSCWYCWHSYYWDSTKCKLNSNILNKYFNMAMLIMVVFLQIH